jgi:hypothetical protein
MEQNRVKNGCDTRRPISKPGYKNSGLLSQQKPGPNSIYHFLVSFFYRSFSPSLVLYPSLPLPFTVVFYSVSIAELYIAVNISASKSMASNVQYFMNVI